MNDLIANPFGDAQPRGNVAAAQMTARENTEVTAMVMMAKRFPRDVIRCGDRILNAFTRATLAEQSQYQFSRGGTSINGPSIRSAEAMAQQWGNMSNGWREVERWMGPDGVGVSLIEAYSVDYESNSREAIQFVVRHWRDTQRGGYALKDERDIYELTANQAQRRKRACILAQIPGDVTDKAMEQATLTLRSTADTSAEGQKKLVAAFDPFGVTQAMLEKKIQRRLDAIEPAQVVMLRRIYKSLDDGVGQVADWFDVDPTAAQQPAAGTQAAAAAAALQQSTQRRNKAKTPAGEAPSPAPEITPPEQQTPAPPPAAGHAPDLLGDTTGAADDAALLRAYLEHMGRTNNPDFGIQLLDEGRAVLTKESQARLADAFAQKFPDV